MNSTAAGHGEYGSVGMLDQRACGAVVGSGMAPQLKTAIDNLIQSNKVVVFIKVRETGSTGHSPTVGQEQASPM
jgi:hypothetical protein